MKTTLMIFLAFVLAGVISVAPAGAEDLEVTIDVLEPTSEAGELAPGLRYLEEIMRRSPLKYQNYLELASAFRSIPLGREETIRFDLRREIAIVIIPKSADARTVRFHFQLREGRRLLLDTELTLARGGTVMVGAPGKPDLMIAVSEGF